MRCDQARERIGPLLDGELANADAHALAAHIDDCPNCRRSRDELAALQRRLLAIREPVPRGLAGRVRTHLAVEAGADGTHDVSAATRRLAAIVSIMDRGHGLLRHAAVILLACAVSATVTWWWVRAGDSHEALAREVLAAHMRSLLQDSAVQVASLDRHTVKPWFAGRLEFTPVVKDLSAEGFQLIGGRLDYVGGKRVAALVYRRHLHLVNVFIWPGSEAPKPGHAQLNGYNLVSWSHAGMTFWATSDLNDSELSELASLL